VHEFCKTAEHTGGVVIENKSRIFKVVKLPVDAEDRLPSVMKKALGYEFFIRESKEGQSDEDGKPIELDPRYGEKYAQALNLKVAILAWDVAQLLKKLFPANTNERVRDPQDRAHKVIYLAQCSFDRRQDREYLESDLKLHGYTVLPDKPLPRDEMDYTMAVKRLLAQCQLSIHLVGQSYGAVPDGPSQKSVVLIQNELAVKQCKSGNLSRIIWLPEGTRSDQLQQQAFIDKLHQDAEVQFGADLISGDIEELKISIHAMLKQLEKQEPNSMGQPATDVDNAKHIYLICDEKDRKATVPIRKYCKDRGFEISIPVFEGTATAVRVANQRLLTSCDGIILFYGAGDEIWKRKVDNELKKMRGYQRDKPLLANYTCLADPKTNDKEDMINMKETNLINAFRGFKEAEMVAFMQAMDA
jgi:hypothetical protein